MSKEASKAVAANAESVLHARIRGLVVSAANTVARGVNLVQVHTCFEIGRHIVEHEQQGEQRAAYGKEIIGQLSERLSLEFGQGFSERNLALMRTFFLCYRERISNLQTLSANSPPSAPDEMPDISQTVSAKFSGQCPFSLSWSHYVFLLGIKNIDERAFYEIEAASQSWTLRELKRQVDSGLYERLALSCDKEGIHQLAKETHASGSRPDADVRQLLRSPRQSRHRKRHHRHRSLQEKARGAGRNHPAQGRQHPRQLYLPGKEELRRKLEEWAGAVGE